MLARKTILSTVIVLSVLAGTVFGESLEENWNDFLHYTKIGRLDLAKGYARAILKSSPEPLKLLEFSRANSAGYQLLLKVIESTGDKELSELGEALLSVIEDGRHIRRKDPAIIVEEIKRLSTTKRGWLAGVKRLRNAGEYAIPFMLDAIADPERSDELANIVRALPEIGKDAIRPLVAALQTDEFAVQSEIVKALGEIGYRQSLPYLKYAAENGDSQQLRDTAIASIRKIDPSAVNLSSARLFYELSEDYYNHTESLEPAEKTTFGNIWFWDSVEHSLSREEVSSEYFYELMSMRCCEWSVKADASFGEAIGLWLAAFFKAELTDEPMPSYFGSGHADAMTYATTAGPVYLHQALSRALKDKDGYVALGVIEALAENAGERSLLYHLTASQPLIEALKCQYKAIRYSAAIAIAKAGPKETFAESILVIENLVDAMKQEEGLWQQTRERWGRSVSESYAVRAGRAMLKLAKTRNPVIDLSHARQDLIAATSDTRHEIQILSAEILAYINDPDAQRAIASMALSSDNPMEVRIYGFKSLAVSAKIHASLLDSASLGAIYELVSSRTAAEKEELRSAAAAAYGALNLPSQKVKDLILDQSKS